MCFLVKLKSSTYGSNLSVFFIAIAFISHTALLHAEEQLPQCFPSESAWEILKYSESSYSDIETTAIKNKQKLNFTFRKSATVLPSFYGFAYLKAELESVPEVTDQNLLTKHFIDVDLAELKADDIIEKGKSGYYDFLPESKGTWVIYLVASLNKIPFLESKGLRIQPEIERQRGGTVFSGASLDLTKTVDYKACIISSN